MMKASDNYFGHFFIKNYFQNGVDEDIFLYNNSKSNFTLNDYNMSSSKID